MCTRRIDSARNSETLDRLKSVLFAAAAAGVSLFALGQPAESEVVVTRKTLPIPLVRKILRRSRDLAQQRRRGNDFAFSLCSFE